MRKLIKTFALMGLRAGACAALALALIAGAAGLSGHGRSVAQEVAASEVPALLRAKGCHACHAMTDTLLGPSYQAIAMAHAARKDVMTDVLAEKIIVGGAGNWGVVPMVRNDQVSPDEARAMAAWVLEQEPE